MSELRQMNLVSTESLHRQYTNLFKKERKGDGPVASTKRQALILQATNAVNSHSLSNYEKVKDKYMTALRKEIDEEMGQLMNLR